MTMTKTEPTQSRTETRNVTSDVFYIDYNVRCSTPGCNKLLLAMATRPWSVFCRHCKTTNHGQTETC